MKKRKTAPMQPPTASQIEAELRRIRRKRNFRSALRGTICTFVIIAVLCAGIAYFCMPVVRMHSGAMSGTVNSGDVLVALKHLHIGRGDLIAFEHEGKTLVRRVAAVSGDRIETDASGVVYVNGELVCAGTGEAGESRILEVEDGCLFVLADADAVDSRSEAMGCIARSDVIGKVCARVWPLDQICLLTDFFGEE